MSVFFILFLIRMLTDWIKGSQLKHIVLLKALCCGLLLFRDKMCCLNLTETYLCSDNSYISWTFKFYWIKVKQITMLTKCLSWKVIHLGTKTPGLLFTITIVMFSLAIQKLRIWTIVQFPLLSMYSFLKENRAYTQDHSLAREF